MGCGASAAPAAYEPQAAADPEAPPAASAAEVQVDGGGAGFIFADQPDHPVEGDPRRPKRENFLPFVRYDTSAVPKEIKGGDHVFLTFANSETAIEGTEDGAVLAAEAELKPNCVFRCWRKDGTNNVFSDGDDVLLEHAETGKYLEAPSDSQPMVLADRDEGSQGQLFNLFKQGRPLSVKHRDTVYLQSWLSNYVEEKYFEGTDLYTKRWQRRKPNTMVILKRAVLEATSTEFARRFQFQALDLDGNGVICKAELEQMMGMIHAEADPEEVMGQADPDVTGVIPYDAFASWADGGGMPEEQLQHIEVLGNIAQRCNDALHEEATIIEVLSTIDTPTTQDMVAKYADKLGAGNLTEEVIKKASEQDGWIFSNYWKGAVAGLLEPEVDLWVRCLNDAMRGWGTDEGTLTALILTIPERLRVPIFQKYLEKTGKHLLDHIKSETSCNYQKVMVWQAMAPEDCRATILNNAMEGLGTNENQLIRVICALDFGERRSLKEAYERMYNRNLVEHVESETNGYFEGDFKRALKCVLEATEAEFDIDADCAAMKEAMEGWGTDEATLTQMICNKTPKQMLDVNKRFQELYDRDLLGWVESETSGHFKAVLVACVRHPMVQLAHTVRECIKGWGTWDTGLITSLVHLPDFKKAALIKTYALEFQGRDLIKDIKNDTSGDYKRALVALVKPAPVVWAEALTGAMKGLGTADQLLINFMVLARQDMQEVRKAFFAQNGKMLEDWIEGDTSGEYKKMLMELAGRNSEDDLGLMPLYWAQRMLDAVRNIDTVKEVLVSMPSVAIKRHTELYEKVYGSSLREDISKKCSEGQSWFSFSNYWKTTMLALLDMPVQRYVRGLWDAMHGWGTDEFTLTGLVCTLPENLYEDIHKLYEKERERKLVAHIESETSFSYKKVLTYQAMSWPESRATALHGAMAGWGTAEDQLIRIVVCTTMQERVIIREAYKAKFKKDLLEHIRTETKGSFKNCLLAVLKSVHPRVNVDLDGDCEKLKEALDSGGGNEQTIVKIVAGKTPEQIEALKALFMEKFEEDVLERVNDDGLGWGSDFRICVSLLLRRPIEALAVAVRDCIVGWGTDDTGLITLLVHLSERKRRDLVSTYMDIPDGGDLFAAIKSDTSGDYEKALLALIKPPPQVWAEALHGAMKGLGTSDELLINWMCIAKDRMDEVREAFSELYGQELADWIEGDCSGDYKDTLLRLASRKCVKFSGQEVALEIAPPASREDAILRFTKTFNSLCRLRRGSGDELRPPEEAQQELGCAFLYFGALSSCAPNLDMPGLWELTNAVGFPPADDGPDLIATFHEWNYSGSGEITWNDFVREMAVRVNDPNHFEADPLPETIDQLESMVVHRGEPHPAEEYQESEPEPDDGEAAGGTGSFLDEPAPDGGTWRDILQGEEPCEEGGMLAGLWGDAVLAAAEAEHTRGFEGACGHVVDFLAQLGHDPFMDAATLKEEECHAQFS